ncbi:MAG TPA: PadR family transcriptional regulator [Candidatus Saccharimonadales bacterium]|nr:PadR family transcriptional regulator [Candidatus Saccharimonadales bacterium]
MTRRTLGLLPQVSFSILFALSLRPRHGYELLQQIDEDSQGKVRLGPGALYGAVKQLHADGLVEDLPFEDEHGRRRYYRLTRKGWNQLQEDLEYIRHIARISTERKAFGGSLDSGL